jgi:hypothetical protein
MSTSIDDSQLDRLRTIGDPLCEELLGADGGLAQDVLRIVGQFGVASPEGDPALHKLLDSLGVASAVNQAVQEVSPGGGLPRMADVEAITRANTVFERYGREIGAVLLLSSLPQAYAASWGVRPLATTASLESHPRRRIRATMQFLVVMATGASDPQSAGHRWHISPKAEAPFDPRHGEAVRTALRLRLFHHAVRTRLLQQTDRARDAVRGAGGKRPDPLPEIWGPSGSVPLNQEDQLATLLTFTTTVFRGLERLGIVLTDDEQNAHLALWDAIGELMGILVPKVRVAAGVPKLRPRTRGDADQLFDRLSGRQFSSPVRDLSGREPPPRPAHGVAVLADRGLERAGTDQIASTVESWPHSATSLSEGRILFNELLEELDEAMPPHARSAPLILMRHFATPRVADRLLMGGGGFGQALLGRLPRRRVRTDRYTVVEVTNPIEAVAMRRLARVVSQHAVTHFLSMQYDHAGRRVPPFRFPGIDHLRGDTRPRRQRR